MTTDRYTRAVLTVIAIALVYLCVLFTPIPTVTAQSAKRPGDPTGPGEVVIVGWRPAGNERFPVQIVESLPLKVSGDVRVTNSVETHADPASDAVTRVALVGWEERARWTTREVVRGRFQTFDHDARSPNLRGVPVTGYAPW
jgi:hypothetical protein